MIRAFFVKDLRLAARAGAPVPGLGALLAIQALLCFGVAAVTIFVGPMPSAVWGATASLVGTVAFVFAFFGPASQAAAAGAAEGNPEIAESLATSPIGPTRFFLGKAALPALQGFALQGALLPAWGFLVVSEMIAPGDVLRILAALLAAVPVSAIAGATRFGGPGSTRVAALLKAAQRRGIASSPFAGTAQPAQQTWIALLGMVWVVQIFRGMGMSVPALQSPFVSVVTDVVRPVIPVIGLDRGGLLPLFGVPVPIVVLSALLLGSFGAMRLARSVAASPRASGEERRNAWRAILASHAVIVLYLAGAFWTLSPGASAAIAGSAALFYALLGLPVLEERLRIGLAAAVPCILPLLATTAGAGLAGLGCWMGIAACCATGAAALPPVRPDSDKRLLGLALVALTGIAAPVLTVALVTPGSPLVTFRALAPVFTAWSWVSLPAAVVSLASRLLGPIPAWSFLETNAPSLVSVPPWLAAPTLFAAIAGVGFLWSGRRR